MALHYTTRSHAEPAAFSSFPGDAPSNRCALLQLQLGDLPHMIGRVLFRRLVGAEEGARVGQPIFAAWWTSHGMLSAPPIKRVYEVLRKDWQEVRFLLFRDRGFKSARIGRRQGF